MHGFRPNKIPELRRESRQSPTSTKKLFAIDTFWERKKKSLFRWDVTTCFNYTPEKAPRPGVAGQPEMDSVSFGGRVGVGAGD